MVGQELEEPGPHDHFSRTECMQSVSQLQKKKQARWVQWYLLFGFDEIASWVEKECDQSYDSETCVEDDQGAGRLEGNTILENTPGTSSWAAV